MEFFPRTQILGLLVTQAPVYLMWLIGIVLAIIYYRRRPAAAMFTLIAMVILLMTSVFGSILNAWLPLAWHTRGLPIGQVGLVQGVLSLTRSLLNAVAFALLLAAIFSRWRQPIPPEAPGE
jgi:uncharacterized membrane protein